MKSNNITNDIDMESHVRTLGHHVRNIMDDPNYHNLNKNYKIKLEKCKKNIPSQIRRIVWNNNKCFIRNIYYNNYLTLFNNFEEKKGENLLLVFSGIPKSVPSNSIIIYWELIPINFGEYYQIKSLLNKQFLYKSNIEYKLITNRDRMNANLPSRYKIKSEVSTTNNKNKLISWTIKMVDNTPVNINVYTIENMGSKQYLYCNGTEYKDKEIFVSTISIKKFFRDTKRIIDKPENKLKDEYKWAIFCEDINNLNSGLDYIA